LFPTELVMGPVSVVQPEELPPELVLDPPEELLPPLLVLEPPLLDDPPELVLEPPEEVLLLLLPPSPPLSNEGFPLEEPQARYVAPTATMAAIARMLRMRQITVIRGHSRQTRNPAARREVTMAGETLRPEGRNLPQRRRFPCTL
jgi:hypothetical protein